MSLCFPVDGIVRSRERSAEVDDKTLEILTGYQTRFWRDTPVEIYES